MKKILIIGLTNILGGVETYIYNIVNNMEKEGIIIDFLIIGSQSAVFQDQLEKMVGNIANDKHFFFSPSLKRNPIKGIKWLRKFYDKGKYDVIYLNTCTSAREIYCDYTIKKYGTKLITHSHNGNATSRLKAINNNICRHHTTKVSSKRLACSDVAYHWLFDDEPDDNSIIPNGIDIKRFSFSQNHRETIREQLNVKDKYIIGHVGRFSKQKNHQYFLKLAHELSDDYHFLLIGDGEQKEPLKQALKQEHIENKFTILSASNDIEKYYSAMDLFAMPSIYEGLPIVAIEAQCNGLPCLLSDKISEQTNICGKCKYLSLDNPYDWIQTIRKKPIRYDETRTIIAKGFSIENTSRIIRKFIDEI